MSIPLVGGLAGSFLKNYVGKNFGQRLDEATGGIGSSFQQGPSGLVGGALGGALGGNVFDQINPSGLVGGALGGALQQGPSGFKQRENQMQHDFREELIQDQFNKDLRKGLVGGALGGALQQGPRLW